MKGTSKRNEGLVSFISADTLLKEHEERYGAAASGHKQTQSIQDQIKAQLYENKPVLADITTLSLPNELLARLYSHQKDGVAWMYGLYKAHRGG